jgi:hypothetical protein
MASNQTATGGSGEDRAKKTGLYTSCVIVAPGLGAVKSVAWPSPKAPDDAWGIVTEAAETLNVPVWTTRDWR